MHDDCVVLIPLDHADVKESGVFAVHGEVHDTTLAIAVILRCLDEAYIRIAEQRHKVLEPVLLYDIVGVDDADDIGIGGGVDEGKTQCAGLKSSEVVGAYELEALTQCAAMLLDRQPQRGIGRVVDDNDAFVVRIIEPRDRIERLLEHLRRLAMRWNMNGDLWRSGIRCERRTCDQPKRLSSEGNCCNFFDTCERNDDQRN